MTTESVFAAALEKTDADVGGTPDGRFLDAALDFMRIARATFADADTAQELYAWELDGPHLRDFTGCKPSGARSAGALEKADLEKTTE
jgi:hypothetical protein